MKTIGHTYPLSEFEPGDVGQWPRHDIRFVLKAFREFPGWGTCACINYEHGSSMTEPALSRPAVYLGRGRIEPARLVMDGEPDRAAELESQVRALREACEESVGQCRNGGRWGMDRCTDRDSCNVCSPLRSALAATDHNAKEKACTT